MTQPLVSIIVPTYNSSQFIRACLESLKSQSYKAIEIIVVDNNSTDDTKMIAQKFTNHVFNYGPERSAQRNYGVTKATGAYVAIIDSDMELTREVISDCVKAIGNDGVAAVIIPEESFGEGFWAKCKALERSFYVGNDDIEAPRFCAKNIYEKSGGYDENLVSGEDWELGYRLRRVGTVIHIHSFIRHNEGHLKLGRTLKKKFYYARRAKAFFAKVTDGTKISGGSGPFARYKLFFSRPKLFLINPMIGAGMLAMKTFEYAFGAVGLLAPVKSLDKTQKKSIVIACHTTGQSGGVNTLHRYLQAERNDVYMLFHPLNDYAKIPTSIELPDNSKEVYQRKSRGLLNLFGDLYLSIKFIRRLKPAVFIGASNFDALPALISRHLYIQRTQKIIYYPRDYAEGRFSNKVLNTVYLMVESYVVRFSDLTVSNTKRSEAKRISHGLKTTHSMVVPNPVSIVDPIFVDRKINKHNFIYAGDISVEHGLYDLIEAISPLIGKLIVIGSGPDWSRTEELLKNKAVAYEALGEQKQEFVIDYLQKFEGIGLAPYTLASKWTYYSSPLKVGEYISCGLPVLMSDVPEIAQQVKADQLGVVYNELKTDTIEKMLKDFEEANFTTRAKAFYKLSNTKTVLDRIPV